MALNRNAIYIPSLNEILIVRGSLDNKTTSWALNVSRFAWATGSEPYSLHLSGRIIGAEFSDAIDERIATQRKSIDLMLDHLKVHCPKLLGTGSCGHIGKVDTNAV